MTLEGWIVVGILFTCLTLLISTKIAAELILLGGLTILIIVGIVPTDEALRGFSNEGLLTVAALYVVAAGLKETGAIQFVVQKVMGNAKTVRASQFRIMTPVMIMSAFFNNTPIVASFIPALEKWSRRTQIPVSKVLIPLSYAAILGGTCTLIGTSTNLIQNTREYTIELIVEEGSSLVKKTIEDAGLRNLPSLFLAEVIRDNRSIPAVAPHERLKANDRLIFTGVVESIIDIQQIEGLKLATNQVFKLDSPRKERVLVEAVVSPGNPIVGKTIKQGGFRERYNAVVLAVSRSGERLSKKAGDVTLNSGDTLLLEAHPKFFMQFKYSREFYLISPVDDSTPTTYEGAKTAFFILIGMVLLVGFGVLSMLQASFLAAGLTLILKCTKYSSALESVDWSGIFFCRRVIFFS